MQAALPGLSFSLPVISGAESVNRLRDTNCDGSGSLRKAADVVVSINARGGISRRREEKHSDSTQSLLRWDVT